MCDDELTPNVTRAAGDATDVDQLTAAELKVRRDTWDVVRFYREHLPGFQNVRLECTPTHVGVRETRQALGDYVMTGDDVRAGRKQPDGIARMSYWIDIHCCLGYTKPPAHVCRRDCGAAQPCRILADAPEELPADLYPPEGDWADIPYRSLTVRGARNLLGGRRQPPRGARRGRRAGLTLPPRQGRASPGPAPTRCYRPRRRGIVARRSHSARPCPGPPVSGAGEMVQKVGLAALLLLLLLVLLRFVSC